ncbi:MAG: 1,4-dihydroxy-6-naphthoate synthase [Rikenellaceae bacterium]
MKLYISPCPNDTFMFDAMVNNRIDTESLDLEVAYYDIEELNTRAMCGEAEFSKISCAIIPQIAQSYTISRSGAALGRGNGPLLVRRKGDKSPLRRVAIPGVHTTANLLLQTLLPEIDDRRPMLFSSIADAIERGEVDGGVLIHEGRFLYAERGLELVADLGLLWESRTSLPLPLGAIAMRSDIDEPTRDSFQRVLARSIAYAFANPTMSRSFIKNHAQELDDAVIESHIALFVNEYSVDLAEEGAAAISLLCSDRTTHL